MTPPATALGRRTAWAVAWTAGARVMRAGVQVLYLLVLARMLSPSDFAVVAIALLAHQLVSVICTETVHQALVHDARWLEHDEVTGFWAQVFICGVTALVLVASGGAFASMLRLPDLIWLMPAIAVGAILAAPTAVPAAKLVAEMRFDRLAVIETTATLLSGIAAIVVALFGFGLASFVVFSVGMRLVEAIGLAASARWRPNGRFSLSSARSLAGFALPLLGVQATQFASNSVDQFFVGRLLGTQSLGLYGFARRLAQQPAQMIAFAAGRATFPALVLARRSGGDDANRAYSTMLRISMLAATTAFGSAALIADPAIRLVLGEVWVPAAPIIAAFCVSASLMPAGAVAGAMLRATGRTNWQFGADLVRLFGLLIALWVAFALRLDAVQLAWVINGVNFAHFLLNFGVASLAAGLPPLRSYTGLTLGAAPMAAAVAMYASIVAIFPNGLASLLAALLAAVVWGVVAWFANRDILNAARKILLQRVSIRSSFVSNNPS